MSVEVQLRKFAESEDLRATVVRRYKGKVYLLDDNGHWRRVQAQDVIRPDEKIKAVQCQ